MNLEELDAIRKRSQTYSSKTDTNEISTSRGVIPTPWTTDRREINKRSFSESNSKWQPFSTEIQRAIEHDAEIAEVRGFQTAKPVFDAPFLEIENTTDASKENSMKAYEVEYRAVITLTAQDIQKAVLHGAEIIKDNLHLIYVKAVHERNGDQLGQIRTRNIQNNFHSRGRPLSASPVEAAGLGHGLEKD